MSKLKVGAKSPFKQEFQLVLRKIGQRRTLRKTIEGCK